MAPARITRSARRRGVLAARGNMIAASFFSGALFYQGICPLCCILSYASVCHKYRGLPVCFSERDMSAFTATIMGAYGADCLSAVLRSKTPRPLSFAYLAIRKSSDTLSDHLKAGCTQITGFSQFSLLKRYSWCER